MPRTSTRKTGTQASRSTRATAGQKRKAQGAPEKRAKSDGVHQAKKPRDEPVESIPIKGGGPCPLEGEEDTTRPNTPELVDGKNPSTPGRLGRVKGSYDCDPDIKPFKGEPGHKVRRSPGEKERMYTDFCRQHEGHHFHELHVCYDKGPDGSPTYDKAGYQLDYDKVTKWMKPVSVASLKRSAHKWADDDFMKKEEEKRNRKSQAFFGVKVDNKLWQKANRSLVKDRISKDLQKPYYKLSPDDYEEWAKRFPKPNPKEYTRELTEDEKTRFKHVFDDSGSALRV